MRNPFWMIILLCATYRSENHLSSFMEQGGPPPAQFMSFPSILGGAILKLLHQILLSLIPHQHPTSYLLLRNPLIRIYMKRICWKLEWCIKMSCFFPCINLWGSVSLLNLPCVFAMCEGFWENNSFCHRKYLKDTHGKNGTTYQEKPTELGTWVLQIDF